ncbi:MAG: DUF1311 domain-containing protein [Alphaproteobacteria bacterium]|nr:DUF1311 domain-containing protein [Alphaproteobacteria bacterium]
MRALLASLLLIGLTPLAVAQAPTPAETRADANALRACIAETMDAGPLEGCIGAIAGPCMAHDGGETTVGLVACRMREHAAWDGELNAVYRRLNGPSASGEVSPLQRAQRAWIVFRDANCDAMAAPFEGGSIARVIVASCMAETTARRAIELLAFERAMEV